VGSNSITLEIVSDQSWVDDVITKIAEAHKKERFSVRRLYIFDVEASYHIRNGFMDI
jgi:nitrogen regulatory protein PII